MENDTETSKWISFLFFKNSKTNSKNDIYLFQGYTIYYALTLKCLPQKHWGRHKVNQKTVNSWTIKVEFIIYWSLLNCMCNKKFLVQGNLFKRHLFNKQLTCKWFLLTDKSFHIQQFKVRYGNAESFELIQKTVNSCSFFNYKCLVVSRSKKRKIMEFVRKTKLLGEKYFDKSWSH